MTDEFTAVRPSSGMAVGQGVPGGRWCGRWRGGRCRRGGNSRGRGLALAVSVGVDVGGRCFRWWKLGVGGRLCSCHNHLLRKLVLPAGAQVLALPRRGRSHPDRVQ